VGGGGLTKTLPTFPYTFEGEKMNKKTISKRFLSIIVVAMLSVALVIPGIAVAAPDALATRTLPASAAPGADLDVSIVASGAGVFGQVVETLPAGFSYVGTDSTDVIVTEDGNTVRFTFMGDAVTFDYEVTASTTAGSYSFSGIVKDENLNEYTVGGDTGITVVSADGATATRTLPTSVAPGADFDVGIVASGAGVFGQVVETLPAGFSYVGTDSTDVTVTEDGDTVSFTFIGDGVAFDYTVTASTTAGSYSFSGIVKDEDLNASTVGGDTGITVASADGASATRTLPTSVAPGADFDVGIVASGCGVFGQVVETLPAGFSYVGTDSTDVIVTEDGSTVEFTFIGDGVTFDYTVTASTVEDTYTFSGTIKDEDLNASTIAGDIDIEVSATPEPPPEVELEFSDTLDQDDTAFLATIPAGVTELEITLSATADLDLNLYDADTFVIGWHGEIDSSDSTTGTYEDDTFAYSGWDGGVEYITADGPLGRAYDLTVYGYRAGDYVVTVSYVSGAPPNPPPTISITVPATVALGDPVTVTVSATDDDGVQMVMFMVSSPYPEELSSNSNSEYEDIIEYVMSFDDEASLTFVPGWAGTYTVEAWASDELGNMTPTETDTFVVTE